MRKIPCLFLLLFLWCGFSVFGQTPNEFYYVNALKSSSKSEVTRIIQDDYTGHFFILGTYSGNLYLDPERPSLALHNTGTSTTASFIAMYDDGGGYLWSMSVNPTFGDTAMVSAIDIDHQGLIYAVGYYASASLSLSPNVSILTSGIPATSFAERTGFIMRINPYDQNDMGQFFVTYNNSNSGSRVEPKDCKFIQIGESPTLTVCGAFRGTSVDFNLDDVEGYPLSSLSGTYSGFINSLIAGSFPTGYSNKPAMQISGAVSGNHVSVDKIAIREKYTPSGYDNDTLYFAGTFVNATSSINTNTGLVTLNAVSGSKDILLGRGIIKLSGAVPDSVNIHNIGSIGSGGEDIIGDIKVSPDKNKVAVVGSYNGTTFDYDPSAFVSTIGASTNRDAFVARYSFKLDGGVCKGVSGANDEFLTNVQIWDDNADTLIVGGYSNSGTISFATGSITSSTSTTDGFLGIVKSVSGDLIGTGILIGGTGVDRVLDMTVSDFGEIVAVGGFQNTVDFDNSSNIYEETSMSGTNAFMVVYGEDLLPFVDSYASGDSDDEVTGLSIDDSGDIFALGTYTGSITIGSGTLTSAGGTDVFVQRKNKKGGNKWAFNAGRVASSGYNISDICSKINSIANDKARSVVTSDTSVYIAYTKNDTAYTQRVNKNTGGPIWTQKINKNGSNIGGITADAQDVYIVGDSAGVQITQRVNKNTGGPIWTQKSAGGRGKAVTQDSDHLYTVKDSSGHTVVSRVSKNTGGPIWTQRVANNSGTSITTLGDDLYMMSDSAGTILLKKVNKNTGGPIWTQRVANGTLGNVTVSAGKGNLYISGTFTGSSSYLGITSSGGTDGFVARVNKNTGGPIWTQRVGGTGSDSIKTLQATAGNDIYIGGNTQGGTFGTSTATAGVFLVRLSLDSLDMLTDITPVTAKPDEFTCQIYPNPTRDMFNVSAMFSSTQFVQIRLVDLRGQIVYQESYNNQNNLQTTIDVGELPSGVYILQIQAGKQQIIRKIIRQ